MRTSGIIAVSRSGSFTNKILTVGLNANLEMQLSVMETFVDCILGGVVEIEETPTLPAGRSITHVVALARWMVPAVVRAPLT